MLRKINPKIFLLFILIFALLSRIYLIWYPQKYVFDEVYHAFTAQEYVKNHKEAWEWWNTPPEGVAYEWTHPPLAKEIMAFSMMITSSNNSWAWRIPGVILGVISIYLVYLIAQTLFKNQTISLVSAFLFSIDGLNFVQSRTGMNDIYLITFILSSVLFALRKNIFICSIFLGLTIASKWTGFYLIPFLVAIVYLNKQLPKLIWFIIIPPLIYLISYVPFFLYNHNYPIDNPQPNYQIFFDLHKQMWWYHTNLKATHDYTSPWWSWPFNLFPVWYFVDYHQDKISNIFASGNLGVFLFGFVAILLTFVDFIKTRSKNLAIILIGYLIFFLPWVFSPRIMFLYHYSPSVPFLTLALGYQLNKLYQTKHGYLSLVLILIYCLLFFALIYPILVGVPLPKNYLDLFFITNITKNPFGS